MPPELITSLKYIKFDLGHSDGSVEDHFAKAKKEIAELATRTRDLEEHVRVLEPLQGHGFFLVWHKGDVGIIRIYTKDFSLADNVNIARIYSEESIDPCPVYHGFGTTYFGAKYGVVIDWIKFTHTFKTPAGEALEICCFYTTDKMLREECAQYGVLGIEPDYTSSPIKPRFRHASANDLVEYYRKKGVKDGLLSTLKQKLEELYKIPDIESKEQCEKRVAEYFRVFEEPLYLRGHGHLLV